MLAGLIFQWFQERMFLVKVCIHEILHSLFFFQVCWGYVREGPPLLLLIHYLARMNVQFIERPTWHIQYCGLCIRGQETWDYSGSSYAVRSMRQASKDTSKYSGENVKRALTWYFQRALNGQKAGKSMNGAPSIYPSASQMCMRPDLEQEHNAR